VVDRASDRPVARPSPIGPGRSFLERFRRSAGVPAVVGDEASAELAPVFAALDELEREASLPRARSLQMAKRRLHDAREEAHAIVADARARADAERGEALKTGLRRADAASAEIVRRAEEEARRIELVGAERRPALVARILDRVLEATP
jgi:vacuolar-type H+-ATPase subunit H